MAVPQKANTQVTSQRDTEAANDAKYGRRPGPTLAYSAAQKKAGGDTVIRNVRTEGPRTSTMPGAPKNQAFTSSHPDSATAFNAEYAKKGVQPQSNLDAPKVKYQPVKQITRSDQATRRSQVEYQDEDFSEHIKQSIKIKPSTAVNLLRRARVSAINAGIWSWGTFCWAVFQLPFALLSIVFLVMSGFLASMTTIASNDSKLVSAGKAVANFGVMLFKKAAQLLEAITGIDLAVLNPQNLFLFTWLIIMAFGMIMLLSMYLIYKVNLLNPLSGRGQGFKYGAFLLAFIGYCVPILNLFPWFFVWTIAVWRYPK